MNRKYEQSIKDLPVELYDILMHKLDTINQTDATLDQKIKKVANKMHPIDLATVSEYYSPKIVCAIYNSLENLKDKGMFLAASESSVVQSIIKNIDVEDLSILINHMDADDISDVFEHLEKNESIKMKRAMHKLDPAKRHKIKAILSHEENSIARFMSTEFIALNSESDVNDALTAISSAKEHAVHDSVFIIGSFGELLGKVSIPELIKHPRNRKLKSIPNNPTYRIMANDTREAILSTTEYIGNYGSIPVIDYSGSLVGVMSPFNIIEIIQEISQDTLGAIGGAEEHTDEFNTSEKILSRAPWLFMTLASGMISATAITTFSNLTPAISFTIVFIPLITGMTGNIGIQTSTVIVRGMAVSGWGYAEVKKMISKEVGTGMAIGLFFGLTVGVIVFIVQLMSSAPISENHLQVGITVGSGLFLSSIWSSMLGVIAPSFFSFMGIDPAISAGPMVTALNDVVAMIIYLTNAIAINYIFSCLA